MDNLLRIAVTLVFVGTWLIACLVTGIIGTFLLMGAFDLPLELPPGGADSLARILIPLGSFALTVLLGFAGFRVILAWLHSQQPAGRPRSRPGVREKRVHAE